MNTTEPSDKQLAQMKEQDQVTPFDMVNLLKYRDTAQYASSVDDKTVCTGREAYNEYAKIVLPMILRLGGSLVYRGRCDHLFVGTEGQDYDEVIVVRYPSRKAYLTMFNSLEYQNAIKHRKAGLEFRVLHGCSAL